MLKNGGGSIINVASIAGLTGDRRSSNVAAKHAVVGYTKPAVRRYAPQDTRQRDRRGRSGLAFIEKIVERPERKTKG
jgi:hypothetical protein